MKAEPEVKIRWNFREINKIKLRKLGLAKWDEGEMHYYNGRKKSLCGRLKNPKRLSIYIEDVTCKMCVKKFNRIYGDHR